MIFRHIFEIILNPFFIFLILLLISTVFMFTKQYRAGVVSLLTATCGFFILSTGWLPQWIIHKLENQYPIVSQVNPEVHWIVVLGGGHAHVPGRPDSHLLSRVTIKRLMEGVRLYKQLPNAKLVLSGGDLDGAISEAQLMKNLASWFSIPVQDIVLEPDSKNTADEARYLKKLLQGHSFYLVTSAVHMPRSFLLFSRQGLNPIAAPTDSMVFWDQRLWESQLPSAYNLAYFNIAWHELLGLAWGKLKGEI